MSKKLLQKDISCQPTRDGYLECSAVVDGYMVHRKYLYYSRRQAIRLFQDYVNNLPALVTH